MNRKKRNKREGTGGRAGFPLRWRTLALVLGMIVVFTTTYSMILPAITLSAEAAQKDPGIRFPAAEHEELPDEETVSPAGKENADEDPEEIREILEAIRESVDVIEVLRPIYNFKAN